MACIEGAGLFIGIDADSQRIVLLKPGGKESQQQCGDASATVVGNDIDLFEFAVAAQPPG